EIGVKFVIIAGYFLTYRNIPNGLSVIKCGKVRIREGAVVHEAAVVDLQHPNPGLMEMRITIMLEKVIHMRRPTGDLFPRKEHIEVRVQPPDNIAGFGRLSSEDAYALDRTNREIGADKHHD